MLCMGEVGSARGTEVNMLARSRAKLHGPSMIEANATNPYQIENPQFVFCIQPYNEGAAYGKMELIILKLEITLYSTLLRSRKLGSNRQKRRTYLCLWEHN
jgi:hypothetical protein